MNKRTSPFFQDLLWLVGHTRRFYGYLLCCFRQLSRHQEPPFSLFQQKSLLCRTQWVRVALVMPDTPRHLAAHRPRWHWWHELDFLCHREERCQHLGTLESCTPILLHRCPMTWLRSVDEPHQRNARHAETFEYLPLLGCCSVQAQYWRKCYLEHQRLSWSNSPHEWQTAFFLRFSWQSAGRSPTHLQD